MKETLNKMKGRPQDEKKAVATGVAGAVVAILLIIWAVLYLQRVVKSQPAAFEDSDPAYNYESLRETPEGFFNPDELNTSNRPEPTSFSADEDL
ncbi:MAG: hypothetical protein AAB421_01515 [Patescibacteria group bacterium]